MNRPSVRQGYNAKARHSTAGQRKKGKRRNNVATAETELDSNAAVLAPKSDEQKELDRRERLRQEVRSLNPLNTLYTPDSSSYPVAFIPDRFQSE